MGVNDNVAKVVNADIFPDSGTIIIGNEYVEYSSRTTHGFSGLKRGLRGAFQRPHKVGTLVILTDNFNPYVEVIDKILEGIGSDLNIDSSGEVMISGAGDIQLATGINALAVRLRIRLQSIFGRGVNNEVGILGIGDSSNNFNLAVARVIEVVQSDPDVGGVSDVEALFDDAGVINVSMRVMVAGLNDQFKFEYKMNYRNQ